MSHTRARATRPKKLNSKQNVQIFREDQIESLADYETQRTAIDTGVEKAEEAVSALFTFLSLLLLVAVSTSVTLSHPSLAQNLPLYRNTICNRPSKHPKPQRPMQRSKTDTFQHHRPSLAMSSMMSCTQKGFNSPPHTSGLQPQSMSVPGSRTVWMRRMNSS